MKKLILIALLFLNRAAVAQHTEPITESEKKSILDSVTAKLQRYYDGEHDESPRTVKTF